MAFVLLVAILVVMVVAMFISARRFAARERKLGKWDDEGPLVETEGPEHRVRNSGMEERLEVIGEWKPPIIRDRRADAERDHAPTDDESTRKRD